MKVTPTARLSITTASGEVSSAGGVCGGRWIVVAVGQLSLHCSLPACNHSMAVQVDGLSVGVSLMVLASAVPTSDQTSTRQQKGQPLGVGLFACGSTTCRNSMWSGRWDPALGHSGLQVVDFIGRLSGANPLHVVRLWRSLPGTGTVPLKAQRLSGWCPQRIQPVDKGSQPVLIYSRLAQVFSSCQPVRPL